MKKNIIILLILLSNSSCNEKSDKTYLAKFIESVKIENSLNQNPLLIVDGYIVEYELMNDGWFLLKKR